MSRSIFTDSMSNSLGQRKFTWKKPANLMRATNEIYCNRSLLWPCRREFYSLSVFSTSDRRRHAKWRNIKNDAFTVTLNVTVLFSHLRKDNNDGQVLFTRMFNLFSVSGLAGARTGLIVKLWRSEVGDEFVGDGCTCQKIVQNGEWFRRRIWRKSCVAVLWWIFRYSCWSFTCRRMEMQVG